MQTMRTVLLHLHVSYSCDLHFFFALCFCTYIFFLWLIRIILHYISSGSEPSGGGCSGERTETGPKWMDCSCHLTFSSNVEENHTMWPRFGSVWIRLAHLEHGILDTIYIILYHIDWICKTPIESIYCLYMCLLWCLEMVDLRPSFGAGFSDTPPSAVELRFL